MSAHLLKHHSSRKIRWPDSYVMFKYVYVMLNWSKSC